MRAKSTRRKFSVISEPVVQPPKALVTPEVFAERFINQMMDNANWELNRYRSQIDEFKEKLSRDPLNALEWSRDAFAVVAKMKVTEFVLTFLNERLSKNDEYEKPSYLKIARELHDWLLRDVIRVARWPSRSTSSQSNEMEREIGSAKAEWLVKIRDHFIFNDVTL